MVTFPCIKAPKFGFISFSFFPLTKAEVTEWPQRNMLYLKSNFLEKERKQCSRGCRFKGEENYLPRRFRLCIKSLFISALVEKQTHLKLPCLSASGAQQDVRCLCKSLHRIKVFTQTLRSSSMTLEEDCPLLPPHVPPLPPPKCIVNVVPN